MYFLLSAREDWLFSTAKALIISRRQKFIFWNVICCYIVIRCYRVRWLSKFADTLSASKGLLKNIVRLTSESWGFICYLCHRRGGGGGGVFLHDLAFGTFIFYKTVSLILFTCSAPYSYFFDPVKRHLSCKMSFTAICVWFTWYLHGRIEFYMYM